ncbi:MAG: STAS domain-containing protein [Hydrogenophilaceae bacterium]|nr:STAS domain-containing protein [Hydrogenophilaceae bacterium]
MRVEADTAYPEGQLTLATANVLLEEGLQAMAQGCAQFDLSGVSHVDSAALSLMMSWKRAAASQGRPLSFRNIPATLSSLATLYGVAEFLDA